MGKQSISRKAWQRAVNVLLWYPDNVAEHASLLTEGADTQRLRLLELEIDAVEHLGVGEMPFGRAALGVLPDEGEGGVVAASVGPGGAGAALEHRAGVEEFASDGAA